MRNGKIFLLISLAGIFFAFGAARPLEANAAASLYITPAGGAFAIGSTFTVSIFLNTGGQAVNAVEADLTFPPNKLQVVSPSAGSSFVQTWVTQPTYSNLEGTLKFQGAVPNPGIVTDAGLISTVTFRVKDIGMAQVKFSDASRVLLNDGKATDILDKVSGGNYSFTLPPPQGPIVVSRTDPDQGKWYSSQVVTFEWNAPPDIQGYSYVLDENLGTIPDDISEGLNTKTAYNDVSDGIHYFHIKALRQDTWGGVSDYEVKIDRTPPAMFSVDVVPSTYTSTKTPIITFGSTDNVSGIDHYELAAISLDKPNGDNNTPFFIEAQPPYVKNFDIGHYEIVVRAYDSAGNYSQSQTALVIVNPILEVIGEQGIRIGGMFMLSWPWAILSGIVILVILLLILRWVWKLHSLFEEYLRHGAAKHPAVAAQLETLKTKQGEYKQSSSDSMKALAIAALILLSAISLVFGGRTARAAEGGNIGSPEPPVITLSPKSISNDEILYLGGEANVPKATVLIYLEQTDTKATTLKTISTDENGNWFYSFPDFLSSGSYVAWAQLKVGEALSPPSPQVAITVAPTAFQIGTRRLSAQDFYLVLVLVFLAAFLVLLVLIIYHAYNARKKKRKFQEEVRVAEESIRRGFSVVRRDIEDELAAIRKVKLTRTFTDEEKVREKKLLEDLDAVTSYVGKEIWELEKMEES